MGAHSSYTYKYVIVCYKPFLYMDFFFCLPRNTCGENICLLLLIV